MDGHLSSVKSIRSFKLDDRIVPHIQLDIWCKLRQWKCLAVTTESLTSYMISRKMWLYITWVSHSYYNFTIWHVFGCGKPQTAVELTTVWAVLATPTVFQIRANMWECSHQVFNTLCRKVHCYVEFIRTISFAPENTDMKQQSGWCFLSSGNSLQIRLWS